MNFEIETDTIALGAYLPEFLDLVGRDHWFRRVNALDEQRSSPFLWKIVADYHWLELGVSFQNDVFEKKQRLLPELVDPLIASALRFVATAVKVYRGASPHAKRELQGRLRDGLNADTGFAALYLELAFASRLMRAGYDVWFADLEKTGRYDLEFSKGTFSAEAECKSVSVDAGRQIHRKHFYRFLHTLEPFLSEHAQSTRKEAVVLTLRGRLSPNHQDQQPLRVAVADLIQGRKRHFECASFAGETLPLPVSQHEVVDEKGLHRKLKKLFGHNMHAAGYAGERQSCFIIMRSDREDDPSKPLLDAMRQAAAQLSAFRPGCLAIQMHGIEATDLLSAGVRKQTGVLANALFFKSAAQHVNAVYYSTFGADLGSQPRAIFNAMPVFRRWSWPETL